MIKIFCLKICSPNCCLALAKAVEQFHAVLSLSHLVLL